MHSKRARVSKLKKLTAKVTDVTNLGVATISCDYRDEAFLKKLGAKRARFLEICDNRL
jgi:hypothetical protein